MTAVKCGLEGMNADTFRLPGIPMRFLDLPDHARIHTSTTPFSGCGSYEMWPFSRASTSISRRPRAKYKNSTPAQSPEVLSAARAVCCHPIHGQDSNRSGPWANRRDAAGYYRIIVV